MSFLHTVKEFFHEGGATMYVTATIGVVSISVMIDRARALYSRYKYNNHLFMSRVKELLLQNRVEDAIQYCNMEKKHLLPQVIKSGLERLGCDEKIVRQSMESKYLEVSPRLTERVSYLSLTSNAGLLFGLLGTVLGLIRQFSALASSEASEKQLLMAKGIAEAMNNTALGLMVALPALVAYGILSARSTKMTEDLEKGASQFMDWTGLYNYGQLRTQDPTEKHNQERAAA